MSTISRSRPPNRAVISLNGSGSSSKIHSGIYGVSSNSVVEEVKESQTKKLIEEDSDTESSVKTDDEADVFTDEDEFEELKKLNKTKLKLTSFSCAPDIDEHPYTSILMFIDKNEFNCCSSDKHRISIYGKKYTNQNSHLLPKSSADLLLSFVNKNDEFDFTIYKNKFFLKKGYFK